MITITKDIKKQISKNQKITGLSAALENYEYGIRNGMFKFVPSRIVYNKRPLAIVSSRDKIVQKGMKHLLEMIFEGSFCDSNHGFRVKRGFHTAINHMRIHFGGARWFIKGDIKRDFELVNHKILMDLIKERVEDQAFIDLLYKYLRVGYIADLYGVEHPKTGVPQGGVISPILSNIYMHGLDLFVEETLKERRVHYIRYGSEFLIGATGSKEDCEEIRAEIGKWLSEKRDLESSVRITHAMNSDVKFLGHIVKKEKKVITIKAPIKDLVKGLVNKGYCKEGGKPTGCGRLVHLQVSDIISNYLQLENGLRWYYRDCSNFRHFSGRMHYILKYSCALTICSKLRLKTLRKTFKRFGANLTEGVGVCYPTPLEDHSKPKSYGYDFKSEPEILIERFGRRS